MSLEGKRARAAAQRAIANVKVGALSLKFHAVLCFPTVNDGIIIDSVRDFPRRTSTWRVEMQRMMATAVTTMMIMTTSTRYGRWMQNLFSRPSDHPLNRELS